MNFDIKVDNLKKYCSFIVSNLSLLHFLPHFLFFLFHQQKNKKQTRLKRLSVLKSCAILIRMKMFCMALNKEFENVLYDLRQLSSIFQKKLWTTTKNKTALCWRILKNSIYVHFFENQQNKVIAFGENASKYSRTSLQQISWLLGNSPLLRCFPLFCKFLIY